MSIDIGTGNHYSVILKDGVIYTAGENTNSQLARGLGNEPELTSFQPINMPAGFTGAITAISGGQLHGAFLTSDGSVYTWGDGNLGKLGNGSTANVDKIIPVKVAALDGIEITSILMGNGASYAISADGVVYSWGQNTNGQLGIGNTTNQGSPVAIPSTAFSGEKIVSVSTGTSFTLFLTESGKVYATGGNVQQQLGPNGSGRSVSSPVLVDIPGKVISIEAGTNTSIVITEDGSVYGWGQSDFGQLVKGDIQADGTLSNSSAASSSTPTLVPGLPADMAEIHIGSRWGIGVTASGEVWVWGDQGWLDATREDVVLAPHRVPDLDGIKIVDIVSGPNHALLVSADGKIYGLGATADGRLGFLQADADRASAPVLIASPDDHVQILVDGANDQTTGSVIEAGTLDAGKDHFHIYGFAGDDTLIASGNGDTLIAGVGNDTLIGGAGADRLEGGEGADRMEGGAGNDTYVIDSLRDAIFEFAGGGDDTVFSSISYRLGSQVDKLTLTGANTIDGVGNDLANTIIGNDAENTLAGGGGNDVLDGMLGNDILRGGAGNDVLKGGGGNDTLRGDAGADRLTGGAGADTFVFSLGDSGRSGLSADRILDFSHAQGDKIDLSGIDADTRLAGDQAFTIGNTTSNGVGTLQISNEYGYYQLRADVDGDGMADFVLLIDTQRKSELLASDFIL